MADKLNIPKSGMKMVSPSELKEMDKEVIALYQNDISSIEIAKLFKCKYNKITKILKNNNIAIRGNSINIDLEKLEKLYYDNIALEDIAGILNTNRVTLRKHLKKLNLIKRVRPERRFGKTNKYSFNEDYFNKIDTKEKAYFLGLLYADGCNTRIGMSISLQKEDSYIIEKFQKALNYTGVLYNVKQKNLNSKPQVTLAVVNKSISKKLSNLGCIPAKSLILKFPTEDQVPNHLISHFIRGYFDGDGCIYTGGKLKIQSSFSIMGTIDVLTSVMQILTKECGLKNIKLSSVNGNTYTLPYGGNKQLCKIRDYLYKDCEDLYLIRKKEKFDNIKIFQFNNTKKCQYCDSFCYGNGVCHKHYQQIKRNGTISK